LILLTSEHLRCIRRLVFPLPQVVPNLVQLDASRLGRTVQLITDGSEKKVMGIRKACGPYSRGGGALLRLQADPGRVVGRSGPRGRGSTASSGLHPARRSASDRLELDPASAVFRLNLRTTSAFQTTRTGA